MLEPTARSKSVQRTGNGFPVRFDKVRLCLGGQELLHDVCCNIDGAGKTVIMGANGAGKSLFLRLFTGLLEPTGGQISGGSGRFSLVFQNPVLLRRSTFANVAYVLGNMKLDRQKLSEKVNEALKVARLEHRAQTPARNLSGGEQQRLALARALVVEPDALLLDEATANLDPTSTAIVEGICDDAVERGCKVIFVTHDVKQAKRVADDILFFHSGRVLAHAPAREFFRNPGSEEAQAYLDGRLPKPAFKE